MKYRAEIDGLRAVAVIPVISFHAGFSLFSGGYVGVDIFFVISGYLITSIILDEVKVGKFSIIKFYERRARRILPALFFILFITTTVGWFWLLPNEYRQYTQSLIGVVSFTSNIFFYLTGGYFGGENDLKPLIHTWSLSVEEQFYLAFPLLMILIVRFKTISQYIIICGLILLSLLFAHWQSDRDTAFNYLLLPSRFWELAAGSVIAMYFSYSGQVTQVKHHQNILSCLGALLIIISVFTFDENTPFPSFYTVIPVLGVSLIILFANRETWVGKTLSFQPMVSVGLISYSAYLWHQVLFSLIRHRSTSEPEPVVFGVLSALTLLLAYITWRFVEQPFRNRHQFSRRNIFTYSAVCMLCFSVFGFAGHLSNGFTMRLPSNVAAAHITAEHEKLLRTAGCRISEDTLDIERCIKGAKDKPLSVAIVGDSHAAALVHQLDEMAISRKFSFLPLVRSACPLNFSLKKDQGNLDEQYCAKYQELTKSILSNSKISTIVIATRLDAVNRVTLSESQQIGLQQHVSAIRELLTLGKTVILVYPIPVYSIFISDYMAKNLWFNDGKLPEISISKTEFHNRIKDVTASYNAIEAENLKRIDTEQIFCEKLTPGLCVTQIHGIPLYYDDDHLSNHGAKLIINEIF